MSPLGTMSFIIRMMQTANSLFNFTTIPSGNFYAYEVEKQYQHNNHINIAVETKTFHKVVFQSIRDSTD